MELICPSCEARYQVPDPSIGEKGRQVSCLSCGHSWHAFPPLVLGSSAAPPTTAAPGIDWQTPPRPGRSSAAFAPSEPEAPPRSPEPPRLADSTRSEQLAEIREMLAEVQSEERAAAALVPDDDYRTRAAPGPQPSSETGGATAAHAPQPPAADARTRAAPVLPADDDEDDDRTDPLRRRMALHDRQGDRARSDVERLRKRHDRRARREQRARDIGSGAFLTGFLLILMVVAVMTALYALQPQIVARMPGMEPMLTEYVSAVDRLRTDFAEGVESTRAWFVELMNN